MKERIVYLDYPMCVSIFFAINSYLMFVKRR